MLLIIAGILICVLSPGGTTYTQEKPKVVKVVQPVVIYVYVDKEMGYTPEFNKPYNDVEFTDPIYKHEQAYMPKYRKKRSVLLPRKTKYSMRAMSTPRGPSYWPSHAGWYLSPHYYYSKSAFQNSQRQKFWNRKIDLHVDNLVAPPQPRKKSYRNDFLVSSRPPLPKRAVVHIRPGSDENVSGTLSLTTVSHPHKAVLVKGTIYGLKPGPHGFHVHMNGELSSQCKDAGGHFNPSGASHASPQDSERHAGDLGNIVTPPYGHATFVNIIDRIISLGDGGAADVAGRAIVVHAGADDLGRGGDDESKKTGNAGARLACGVIQLLN